VAIPGKKRLADIMPREVFDRIDETKYKQGNLPNKDLSGETNKDREENRSSPHSDFISFP
jgi:hypothetical protein